MLRAPFTQPSGAVWTGGTQLEYLTHIPVRPSELRPSFFDWKFYKLVTSSGVNKRQSFRHRHHLLLKSRLVSFHASPGNRNLV